MSRRGRAAGVWASPSSTCSSGESGGSSAAAASAAVACSLRSLKKRQIHAQASGSERRASQPSEMIVPMMRGWPSAKAAHARPRGVSALHKAADDVGGVILVGGPPGSGEPPASTLEGPRVICAAVGSTKPYSSSQRTAPSHSARSWLRVAINSASRALRVDTWEGEGSGWATRKTRHATQPPLSKPAATTAATTLLPAPLSPILPTPH
eukprot:scaffold3627_cov124-Isochrysis_galbana.AAC.6